ncbi:MAG: hypothetical protein NZ899_09385 [Thermoguttaceae bacterium]|nr:hypothetical protein [Thermoguttaceae bacterium]MDW8079335.1 hypothetical protein [Thermoguttaceae bacterium]
MPAPKLYGRRASLLGLLSPLPVIALTFAFCLQYAAAGQRADNPHPVDGLLLLRNGSVIEGSIRNVPGGYAVRVPNGEITVAESQVDAFCTTLEEAYEHRRNRLPVGDMKAHVELALWCLRYHLLPQAEAEIHAAESISPQHPMLPLLRRRLELLRQGGESPAPSPSVHTVRDGSTITHDPAVRPATFEAPTNLPPAGQAGNSVGPTTWPRDLSRSSAPPRAEMPRSSPAGQRATSTGSEPSQSLPSGGNPPPQPPGSVAEVRARQRQISQVIRAMPPGAVLRFTQSIQPIMTHHCGTAQCHGGIHADKFRWLRPPGGMLPSTQTTQENLLATLQLINWDEPTSSPLLRIPLQPHGGMPTPVFAGPQSSQYRELVEWVLWVTAGGSSTSPLPAPTTQSEANLTGPPSVANTPQPTRQSGPGGEAANPLVEPNLSPGGDKFVPPDVRPQHQGTEERNDEVVGPPAFGLSRERISWELPANGSRGLSRSKEGWGALPDHASAEMDLASPAGASPQRHQSPTAAQAQPANPADDRRPSIDIGGFPIDTRSTEGSTRQPEHGLNREMPPLKTAFPGASSAPLPTGPMHAVVPPGSLRSPEQYLGEEPSPSSRDGIGHPPVPPQPSKQGSGNHSDSTPSGEQQGTKTPRWFFPWKLRLNQLFR